MSTVAFNKKMGKKKHAIEFSTKQWEELESLQFTGFTIRETMWRDQWFAVLFMCRGKALMLRNGKYDESDNRTEKAQNRLWAEELDEIADQIESFFQPADGKY